jgi:chromosome segregation ATPase
MDFHGDGGSMNHTNLLDYIKNQLPNELTTLVNLQAELAQRQGAMNAVADTLAARDEAKAALETAKTQSDDMLTQAKDKLAAAKAKAAAADAKDVETTKAAADFAAASSAKSVELTAWEKKLSDKETDIAYRQEKLTAAEDAVVQDRAALEARIKAFQDKVAALSP